VWQVGVLIVVVDGASLFATTSAVCTEWPRYNEQRTVVRWARMKPTTKLRWSCKSAL